MKEINQLKSIPTGFDVIVNDLVCIQHECKQYKFPKSKKKRIREKWGKRQSNYRVQKVHKVYYIQGRIVVSTKVFEKLMK